MYDTDNRPEADPAVLLAWVETADDLAAIHNAAKVTNENDYRISLICLSQATTDYSITVSQEFANEFWKKELTQVVYKLYPTIMDLLRCINSKVSPLLTTHLYLTILSSLGILCL